MSETEADAKSLESLHLKSGEPSASWSAEDLGAAAAAELAALAADEQSVTARYWRLGRLLSLARKPLTHGQWGGFLKQWKIDKTRAAKAIRIFKEFASAEETAGLTVARACEKSAKPRRRRATRPKSEKDSAAEAAPPPIIQSWWQFADAMTGVVERQLEEPEFLAPDEAARALAALSRLLATLHACEERLRRRTTGDGIT